MKNKLSYLLLLFAFFLSGCDRPPVAEFTDFVDFGPDGIPEGWDLEFSPTLSDTTKNFSDAYCVVLALRYSKQCPSQSVIFNIEEFSLQHEKPEQETVEIYLFNDEGNPLGIGNYGLYEVTDTLRRGFRIPENYTFSISSQFPASATKGIKSLGFILTRY